VIIACAVSPGLNIPSFPSIIVHSTKSRFAPSMGIVNLSVHSSDALSVITRSKDISEPPRTSASTEKSKIV